MTRVAVTGIGVVSPVGHTLQKFWSALVEARTGIRPITIVPTERLTVRIAAQIDDFNPAAYFEERFLGQLDRFSQFAIYAAREAMRDSGFALTEEIAEDTAVIVGSGAGGQTTIDETYYKFYGENAKRVHPLTVPRLMTSAAGSQITIDLKLKGPSWTVSSACASATHAIGQAFHMVRSGQVPLAIAGGSDALITPGTVKAWEGLRALSTDTCRPFSRTRTGLVLGEGAAIVVLEPYESAAARGARIYAEVLGFGATADAFDLTAADPGGAARAMRFALKDARRSPDDVDYVNAHGTGTPLNDKNETLALYKAFGPRAETLPTSSSKGVLGHSLGAAGALEFAATAMALHTQTIPPTANFQEYDPGCAIDCVPNTARQAKLRTAISNSFAFGGLNAVLALGAV